MACWAFLCLIALAICSSKADVAHRLAVRGQSIVDPRTSEAVFLQGFNDMLHSPPQPYSEANATDFALRMQLLPGINIDRLVSIHWDDEDPLVDGQPLDCRTSNASAGYMNQTCLEHIEWVLSACRDRGVYATLTVRAAYAAGGDASKPNVFTNSTLRQQYLTMLTYVAAHFSSTPGIAAFEPMSEPRTGTPEQVMGFYADACKAVRVGDPDVPCLVGPAKYYDFYALILNTSQWSMPPGSENIIYSVDFFLPTAYNKGEFPEGIGYPASQVECKYLYAASVQPTFCPGGNPNALVDFNLSFLQVNMALAAEARARLNAPIFVDQCGSHAEAIGRLEFQHDLFSEMERQGMHYAVWQWKAPSPGGYGVVRGSNSSSGSPPREWVLDEEYVELLHQFMGPQ